MVAHSSRASGAGGGSEQGPHAEITGSVLAGSVRGGADEHPVSSANIVSERPAERRADMT